MKRARTLFWGFITILLLLIFFVFAARRWTDDEFAKDRIQAGKSVPAFTFVSLDDPKVTYTNWNMLGKVYIIDFWATWCGPCVGEMKYLHEAHKKYRDEGLEIISVSLDSDPGYVRDFRRHNWSMPWRNTVLDKGFQSDVADRFRIWGIPAPILVNRTGRIIATEGELRGESLDRTLAHFLTDNERDGIVESMYAKIKLYF
jgi:thiol-disulfide isomerase/thioredoxin